MFRLVICVCTFRNPSGLKLLLEGLDRQRLSATEDREIGVVVVDNDDQGSAGEVLTSYARNGRFQLEPVRQPARGLSSARNAALDASAVRSSDYFAFLDDDEIPEPVWLQSLLDAFQQPGRAIVVGPVEPRFLETPADWILQGGFFRKPCLPPGELHNGYTSNVMIRTDAWRESGIRFDESLNQTGGEDAVFFRELRRRGLEVHCAPKAVVYETIPPGRATLAWNLRRWTRAGATSALLEREGALGLLGRLQMAGAGAIRLTGGAAKTGFVALTRGRKDFPQVARSLSTVCRGLGMFMAAFGHVHKEYGRSYRRQAKD